ncbi:hypothetical protein PR048_030116 [Dryococelus australis]|uniref:Uncharacterized protein n=1 Tax=Dryococelus australis TaxID=614101 RepID=A0ABQ9G8G2_9NEOP|nr:hypothetical protein PR048_030116 [Dryococelus australis]
MVQQFSVSILDPISDRVSNHTMVQPAPKPLEHRRLIGVRTTTSASAVRQNTSWMWAGSIAPNCWRLEPSSEYRPAGSTSSGGGDEDCFQSAVRLSPEERRARRETSGERSRQREDNLLLRASGHDTASFPRLENTSKADSDGYGYVISACNIVRNMLRQIDFGATYRSQRVQIIYGDIANIANINCFADKTIFTLGTPKLQSRVTSPTCLTPLPKFSNSHYLACSPSTKAIRVQSPAGSLRIFACENRTGRCRWLAGFLGDLLFPPPFHYGVAPYSPQTPSSALNTSIPSDTGRTGCRKSLPRRRCRYTPRLEPRLRERYSAPTTTTTRYVGGEEGAEERSICRGSCNTDPPRCRSTFLSEGLRTFVAVRNAPSGEGRVPVAGTRRLALAGLENEKGVGGLEYFMASFQLQGAPPRSPASFIAAAEEVLSLPLPPPAPPWVFRAAAGSLVCPAEPTLRAALSRTETQPLARRDTHSTFPSSLSPRVTLPETHASLLRANAPTLPFLHAAPSPPPPTSKNPQPYRQTMTGGFPRDIRRAAGEDQRKGRLRLQVASSRCYPAMGDETLDPLCCRNAELVAEQPMTRLFITGP